MNPLGKRLFVIQPEPDTSLNFNEIEEVKRIASEYIRVVQRPELNLQPAWLLNDRRAPVWKTHAGKSTRFVRGEWIGTLDVHWDKRLPDGSLLTDAINARLLENCQDIAILYRDGYAGRRLPAITTWRHFAFTLKDLSVWAVLQEGRFSPRQFGFSLLDQQSLRELFVQVGIGGWTEAHGLVRRCMERLYFEAFREPYVLNLDLTKPLSDDVVQPICTWLDSQKVYERKSRGLISRAFLGELISADKETLCSSSSRLVAFLRQFEPRACNGRGLLVIAKQNREFPGHRTITLDAALSQPVSFASGKRLAGEMDVLSRLYRHLPERLIKPDQINVGELKSIARSNSVDIKSTPLMPLETGMRYFDIALQWVERYGDALVDYFLKVMKTSMDFTQPYAYEQWARSRWIDEILNSLPTPDSLADISAGFARIGSDIHEFTFEKFRAGPTIHEAVEVLIGAIVFVIATLNPSRSSEISTLRRDCLHFNGYYYLKANLAKHNVGPVQAEIEGKPLPAIAAKAIKQMQRLAAGLNVQCEEHDEYYKELLFVFPSRYFGKRKENQLSTLDRYLDRFCDYCNLPTDELGRRWYVRIHELRRWTLLLLVWSGRESVLDAASYLAGHTNADNTYTYYALEGTGESFESLEAVYVGDRLRTRTGFSESESEFIDLYDRVLRHFKVAELDLVPEREFRAYMRELQKNGAFHVEPFWIQDDSDKPRFCVALRKGRK